MRYEKIESLYWKINEELDQFIKEWKNRSSAENLEFAYELVYKEDIFYSLSLDWPEECSLTNKQVDALLKLDHPLDYLYREWMKCDQTISEILMDSNRIAIEKLFETSSTNNDSDTSDQNSENPLEAALMSFESGHSFDPKDFNSKSNYEKYCEYMDYGPEGFYEEFHDQLDFSSDFIEEYGRL